MTDNYFLSKEVKIKVPRKLDDPLVGRVLALPLFFPFNRFFVGTDYEYIIIKEGKLILQGSTFSGRKTTSFQLANIEKFILRKRKVSCFDRAGKYNFWGRLGTEVELSLVDIEGENYVIIPIILTIPGGSFQIFQKEWERFLRELRMHTGLSIEETGFS
jgi:hypothetical protein